MRKFTTLLFAVLFSASAFAHCDGLDGPVVKAARQALDKNNVNLALIWVQPKDEPQIREAFQQAVASRKQNPDSDRKFFETLVRVHREGEGAVYDGLKPAGREISPAITAADQAVESGSSEALLKHFNEDVRPSVQHQFERVIEASNYDRNDVAAGRQYVQEYVTFVHMVERIEQGGAGAAEHSHDHH